MSSLVFPTLPGLAWSVLKTPIWKTVVQESISGMELRVSLMSYPRYRIVLTYEVLRSTNGFTELQTLISFFNQVRGSWDTFLWLDPDDNTCTGQNFGTGDGATRIFNLSRLYGSFTEPVQDFVGTPALYANGVLQTAGTDYTVALGVVTFTSAPAVSASLTWTGQFYKRVRFTTDETEFEAFMYGLWAVKKVEFITVKQ